MRCRVVVYSEKKVVGLVEDVKIVGMRDQLLLKAKMDTGASRTSVDSRLAAKVGLGPIMSSVRIKSSTGGRSSRRPLAQATVMIAGERFDVLVSIADRHRMKNPMIIGMDILGSGRFLIDPSSRQMARKSLNRC